MKKQFCSFCSPAFFGAVAEAQNADVVEGFKVPI